MHGLIWPHCVRKYGTFNYVQMCFISNETQIKFSINPTLEESDMYGFKMSLFDSGDTKDFILFQHNCQMIIKAPGNITAGENPVSTSFASSICIT